jgi:glycosyltransferase involved in cell wall biosynthesis
VFLVFISGKNKFMNILIISASLYLTDNKPAGEGLIAYEIIKRLSKKHNLTVIAPKIDIKSKLNCRLIEAGGDIFFPSPTEFLYKFRYWKYMIKTYFIIKKILRKNKFDIHYFMMPVNINQTFSLFYKKPFIAGPVFYPWIDIDDTEYGEYSNKSNTLIDKIKYRLIRYNNKICKKKFITFLNNSDKIILTLPKVKKVLPNNLESKFEIIPVGCNTKYFLPSTEKNDTDKIAILFTAYLVKRKGLQYLLDAMKIIKLKTDKNIVLNIVGDGPDKLYFENIMKKYQLKDCVNFIGFVEHNDTLKYFQNADIYCHPALGEPFGLSIVEAMSCGLPIVVFNLGGAPEVLTEKNNNFIAEPRNTDDLANKLLALIENKELRIKTGQINRNIAVNNYDWDIIANKILSVIN